MKTLHLNFKIWPGDPLYYAMNSKIETVTVKSVDFNLIVSTNNYDNETSCYYTLSNDDEITEDEIGNIYFTDSKELFKKLISEI